ncbi:MAG: CbiQ family ECF transporter T component [Archaeoglobaceae archaeon]
MHILIERTLRNASSYFQNFFIHEYQRRGILHELDARFKFVATLIFIILAVSTFDHKKLLFLLFSLLIISSIFGLSILKLFKRTWLFFLFSFLVVSPLFFSNPLYPILFSLRVLISLFAVQMLLMSTTFYELCVALKAFRVPDTFLNALWLAYRYILVVFQEIINIMLARESRRVVKGSHREVWKKGGEVLGLFLLRNMERAERLQLAMISRGEKIFSAKTKFGKLEISYISIVAVITLWWIML